MPASPANLLMPTSPVDLLMPTPPVDLLMPISPSDLLMPAPPADLLMASRNFLRVLLTSCMTLLELVYTGICIAPKRRVVNL